MTPQDATLKNRQTRAYYLAFIVLGLSAAVLGPTIQGLAGNTGSTIGQISILFTTQAFGYLLGSLASGWRFDRVPPHPLLAALLVLLAAAFALVPLTPTLLLLAGLFFLVGLSQSSLDVGGNTLLVWVHQDRVGPRMNALHFFFGLGAFLAPLIVARVIVISGDIIWAYWLVALVALAPALILFRLASPRAPAQSTADGRRADPLLVILIAALFFLFVGAELGFGGWIYTYGVETGLATAETAGYLTSFFWGALTLGRLLSIPLAARLRPPAILGIDFVGLVGFMVLLLGWSQVPGVAWIAGFGFGLSMANVFPTLMTLAEAHLPITGRITSWFIVGSSLGSMIIPWLMGQSLERRGPSSAMWIVLVCVLLAAIVFAGFQLAARRRTAQPVTANW
jgi:fucose permease